jgi:ATP-binding cassette, subfamily B, bacterial MsbA
MSAAYGFQHLLRYAKPHWRLALIAVAGMALEASVAAAFTYLMKSMLDDVFVARDATVTRWLPWFILALFAVRAIGVYIGDSYAARISRSIVRDVREQVFARYLHLPSAFFVNQPAGPLMSRLTVEAEQLGQACTEGFKILVADGLLLIALLAVMLSTSVKLTLAVLLIGPAIGWIVSTVAKRYKRLNRTIQASMGDITQLAQTAIQGERDVKIFGAAELELARFQDVNQHNFKQQLKVTGTNAISTSLVQFLAASALALVVFVAARPELIGNVLTPGEFMSFISAMLVTLPSLKRLTNVQNILSRGSSSAASLEQVLAQPKETDIGTRTADACTGTLELNAVSVDYSRHSITLAEANDVDARAQADDFRALKAVSLTLKPGTVTALVGRSGGGKSTLAALLPRLIVPSAGEILLDGVPLSEYTLASLRQQIAWVGQQLVLNADTVLGNVAYGAAVPDRARALQVLERASAMEFVSLLPQGIDSRIGQQGAQLSGGQRQRLAIARALYKQAKILVLDEATSALDNDSERAIQAALAELKPHCTTLVIAHRLSTIEQADHIVVLEAGSIVEQGTHAALLIQGGRYAELYRRGFEVDAEVVKTS